MIEYQIIDTDGTCRHRTIVVTHFNNLIFHVNKIPMFAAKFEFDPNWWLIPQYVQDELTVADIGPFSDFDLAIVFAKLIDDGK